LYRKQVVDGVYRLDKGALLDDFFRFFHELGVGAMLLGGHGMDIEQRMVPFMWYLLLHGLKILVRVERINALPVLMFSDGVLMPLVGFNAPQVQYRVC
jgi:hypothetical protein